MGGDREAGSAVYERRIMVRLFVAGIVSAFFFIGSAAFAQGTGDLIDGMTDLYAGSPESGAFHKVSPEDRKLLEPVFGQALEYEVVGFSEDYRCRTISYFDKDKNPLGSSHGCQDLSAADAKPVIKYYDKNGVLLKESS